MNEQQHTHEEEGQGVALGVRIFEHQGALYYAEAEIGPYLDEPQSLGATLVFHDLSGVDPTASEEEQDWPAWSIDIDDDLTRDPAAAMSAQFEAILRQLSQLSQNQLNEHLENAQSESPDE